MAFTHVSRQAIERFAQQLGLPARPARDGSFTFVFADRGALTMTPSRDGRRVVVSLAQRPPRVDGEVLGRALARAGLDPAIDDLVHVGLTGDDSLVFSVGVDDGACDLPMLESCLQALSSAHRSIA